MIKNVPFWRVILIMGVLMLGWGVQRVYGKSLHIPLSFVVNLKLINSLFKKVYVYICISVFLINLKGSISLVVSGV